MTYRTFRRRARQALAGHDWLEGVLAAVGVLFLALGAVCVVGLATTISGWNDADPGSETSVGFLSVTRGFGVVLFGLLAFLSFGVGWLLAGAWIRRLFRRDRGGS